jgi:hypothetical protein
VHARIDKVSGGSGAAAPDSGVQGAAAPGGVQGAEPLAGAGLPGQRARKLFTV